MNNMKKIIIIITFVFLLVGGYFLFQKYYFNSYIDSPKYSSVTEFGFSEIREPDDFRRYYLDVIDSKGYNKKDIRYSAFHEAFRNAKKGSDVYISSLIALAGYTKNIDDQIYLQREILKKYMGFNNKCYNTMCRSGHSISSVASDLAKNLVKMNKPDEAINTMQSFYKRRKKDLKGWVRFSILENNYFILKEKKIKKNEIEFFVREVNDLKTYATNKTLLDRYKYLKKWQQELITQYERQ